MPEPFVSQPFRRRTPRRLRPLTTTLVEGIAQGDITGTTLLDVGGRVGRAQRDLYQRGVTGVTHVDPSRRRLQQAHKEAARSGRPGHYVVGQFIDLAPGLQSADFVTVERAASLRADFVEVLGAAVARARKRIGIVIARDAWWVQAWMGAANAALRAFHRTARFRFNRPGDIYFQIRRNGFRRVLRHRTLLWQVEVYERTA